MDPLRTPVSWGRLRALLPEGIPLAEDQWVRRHRAILTLLWLHVPALMAVALWRGNSVGHGLVDGTAVAVFAVLATETRYGGRRLRAVATAAGLVSSSAMLVHLSGGVIESHFHFFVIVGVITLYQDWRVFAAAILFVALHHGVVGTAFPEQVYNHPAAVSDPWKWAAIHAAFIFAASAAQITAWRFAEEQVRRADIERTARSRRFASLIENSSDGVTLIGADGRILYESPSVATILGLGPESRIGANPLDFLHPDDRPPGAGPVREHGA